jgi:ABC-type cobalamin transport system ATPase subunit
MGIDGHLRDLAAGQFVRALHFQRRRAGSNLESFRQRRLNQAGGDLLMNLHDSLAEIVFEKLLALRDGGMTIVMVEQKASHALGISDRGYVMHLGQLACEGSARDLLQNDDVKRLFLGEVPESMKALNAIDA